METSGKDTDSEAKGIQNTGMRPHRRRAKQDASIAMQSLQLAAEEFRKFCKPKIPNLKGAYSAKAMLVFNSWLKDDIMCIREWKLTNLEAFQLIKDYTIDKARGVIGFYLDTNSTWEYKELIKHRRTPFESHKTFS